MEENLTPTPEPTPDPTPSPTPVTDYRPELQVISKELADLNAELDELQTTTQTIQYELELTTGYLEYVAGFALFGVVVTLCYFIHKFFKMFF